MHNMISQTLDERIEDFWKTHLECGNVDFASHSVYLFEHGKEYQGYNGASLYMRRNACLVSLPHSRMDQFSKLTSLSPSQLFDVDTLQREFGPLVDRIIGPAYYGYADSGALCRCDVLETGETRILSSLDPPLLERFSKVVGEENWGLAGLNEQTQVLMGAYSDGQIAALAGYDLWGKDIAHIGVITHPAFLGRGYGKKILYALSAYGAQQGLIMQYRTARSNLPSIAIAGSIGFKDFASSLAVRFKELKND